MPIPVAPTPDASGPEREPRARLPAPARAAASDPLWLRLAPLVFCTLWSGGYTAVKVAKPFIEPIYLLALRYAIVVALLVPAFLLLRPRLPTRGAHWGHLVMTGVLVQGFYFGMTNIALMLDAPASVVAIVLALQPILVGILAPRLVGERVGLKTWLGLLLGLSGATIVILARSAIAVPSAAGLGATLGALVFITAGTLYEKRFGSEQHPVVANLVQCGAALALALPLAWLLESLTVTWSLELVLALGYLIVANSLIAMTLLFAMLRRGAAARVSSLFFLVPPIASLMALAVLNEAIPPLAWAGMALAALGVALAMGRI